MNENKMGTMDIKSLIIKMSVPIMLSMLVQALYNIVDSMFVARVSQEALSAVSICYPIQMIIVAVSCGTGVGINTLLSRFLGEKKYEKADAVANHGIIISLINGAVFALIGLVFAQSFISIFSNNTDIINMGSMYMYICTTFSFGVFVQITYERIMQATGNAFFNMVIQGIGALVNIVLDPIFIFGMFGVPALGVSGAAIATVLGQMVAMLLGIWITNHKIEGIHINILKNKWDFILVIKIYKIAIPAILMQSIMSFMTVFMNMILTTFSTLAVSVFSIYYKLQQFVFMAVLGMNNALIPIVSYNYGAKKKRRIFATIHFSLILSCIIMFAGVIVFQLFPTQLLYLFDANSNMLSIGIPAMKTISLSFIFAGISVVLCAVFQALDHGFKSLIITLLRQMVLLIPITSLLAEMYGLEISWWSFPITEGISCLLALFFYKLVKKQINLAIDNNDDSQKET